MSHLERMKEMYPSMKEQIEQKIKAANEVQGEEEKPSTDKLEPGKKEGTVKLGDMEIPENASQEYMEAVSALYPNSTQGVSTDPHIYDKRTGQLISEGVHHSRKEILEKGARRTWHNADLSGTNIRRAEIHMSDFGNADFSNSAWHGSDLSNNNFQGATFNGADLSGVRFKNADLRGADLSGATGKDVDLRGAQMDENTKLPPRKTMTEGHWLL
jgi:hypothetical protein